MASETPETTGHREYLPAAVDFDCYEARNRAPSGGDVS